MDLQTIQLKTGLSKNEAGAKVNAYDGIAIGNGALSGSNSGTAGNAHVAIGLMSQATGNTAMVRLVMVQTLKMQRLH